MFQRIGESIELLVSHLVLFSLITLTVWLPGNLVIDYLIYNVFTEEQAFLGPIRAKMWIEGIFGPIYIGAMIHALWKLKQGRQVTYAEAIGVGFSNWGRLFAARFIAGLIIAVGLIAFIVPGIMLSLRYALMDPAVILEGAGAGEARRRSGELTKGVKLQILVTASICYLGVLFLTFLLYLPLEFVAELNTMAVEVVIDCILDIAYVVLTIAIFLYYWDARQKEAPTGGSGTGREPGWDDIADMMDKLPDTDDDNPYRSPRF